MGHADHADHADHANGGGHKPAAAAPMTALPAYVPKPLIRLGKWVNPF